MTSKRKKICIIYCGALDSMKKDSLASWHEEMSELNIIADTEIKFFYSSPTSNITPRDWEKLASIISNEYEKFDGFVVLHGSDSILYTSSAISFLLQNFGKPIVFTCGYSQKKPAKTFFSGFGEISIKANLINAVQVSALGIDEVTLVYGNKIFRANCSKIDPEANNLNIFYADQKAILGKIDFSIRIYSQNLRKTKFSSQNYSELDHSVMVLPYIPCGDAVALAQSLQHYRGVIIDLANLKSIPENMEKLIQKLHHSTIIAVRSRIPIYFVGYKSAIINVSHMTPETALTKFMWALKAAKNKKDVKKLMDSNISGEIL